MASSLNSIKYRCDIDGLRAIAVLSVVGFHAFGVKGGFIGVDIFFVISGFLISTILLTNLENNSFSFVDFYKRRVKRIFPALILVLLACCILGWFVLLPDEYKQLGKHIAGASVFISNFLLWGESGYFDNAAITKPLLHLWSLGVEEQFYIIWPLLLWISWKSRINLIYVIAIIAIVSFILNIKDFYTDSVAVYYSPQTRFWELLCGGFIAWLTVSRQKMILTDTLHNTILSIFGLLLIITGLFVLSRNEHFVGWALIPTIGATCIILAGPKAWVNRVILSHPILIWFGLISFPLYLWHWPLLVFSKLSIADGVLSAKVVKISAVLLSILLAWMTYVLIETPIRFGKNNKIKIPILILLIGLVGGFGFAIYYNNGLDYRVPSILQGIQSAKYNHQYRTDPCFGGDNRYHFGACTPVTDPTKKSVMLWGDSHAAHFYPGYEKRFGNKLNIVLISETGCRPILENKTSDEKCYEINNAILDKIKKEKPDRVVLSAAWAHHDDWMGVAQTIDQLKLLGVKNIDLIGPAPDWIDTLPRQLFIYSRLDKEHRIPTRMSFGLDTHFLKVDASMQTIAERKKVNYISLAKILCNNKGCITRVGDNFENLVTLDYGHFTDYGSIYIISKIPNILS